RAARAHAALALRPRRLLQRLRLRGEPPGGGAPARQGHPRGHPARGLAGLAGRPLPDEDRRRALRPGLADVLRTVLAVALGAIFFYASYDKIAHPGEFARIVYHYRLIGPSQAVGPWAANLLAVTLPWIEAMVGLSLVTGVWRREGAALAAALLV